MPDTKEEQRRGVEESTLGEELRKIRDAHGLTLRAVERATGISNAYLSQLETGKIEKPSPNYLYRLAEEYKVPYELLMEKAGYIGRTREDRTAERGLLGAALASIDDLTPEEEDELMRYLAFLRSDARRARRA